ncbi:hypothetical protein FRC11_003718 [Ceratobasidium sp. 423]|nr:hypothetical protein FRC11_003718 [Ceratobasidium sp. 423]
MSQCPTVPGTQTTVLATQPSWVVPDATPYLSQAASTVMQSQEPSLGHLSPRGLKRRLDLQSSEDESQISSRAPPQSRQQLGRPTARQPSSDGVVSAALSMAASVQEGVPAPVDPEEDIGVVPQSGRRFCQRGKCYLLTYSQYVRSEDVGSTTCYDTIKELIDHLYTLQGVGGSLLEYAVGVTESHDLEDGQWTPAWHCHVIVWARTLITSEGLNLWTFKGCRPHERLLQLRVDSGGFPPLAAYQYLKKELAAWEARYGNLTEEFLQGQNPNKDGEGKSNRKLDFTYAMEAPDQEEFLA